MRRLVFLLLPIITLSACVTIVQPPTSTPAVSPAPSETPMPPTATTDWFPMTATSTPIPEITLSPTPELRTGIGALFFEENFEEGENWDLYPAAEGSATVTNNHLTLVLTQPDQYAYATHRELFIFNFYGEITAQPNLCGGEDEYGILLRTKDLSDYYRLAISCDGSARVNRSVNGALFSVIPSTDLGIIETGPPGSVKIAFWALDNEIRFFLNEQFLFSVQDLATRNGTIGTFIHSAGESTISVNFSDLSLWELSSP